MMGAQPLPSPSEEQSDVYHHGSKVRARISEGTWGVPGHVNRSVFLGE